MIDQQVLGVAYQYCDIFLTGATGAFIGSYLKKRGENLATRDDLDKLVVQVSAVTAATQRIEAKTTRSLRVHERQLLILTKLYRHLNDVQALFQNMTRRGRLSGEMEQQEYAPLLDKSVRVAYDDFLEGRLFIPPVLVKLFDSFFTVIFEGRLDFEWANNPMNLSPAQRGEAWRKAANAANKEIPKILEEIELAARALIGE